MLKSIIKITGSFLLLCATLTAMAQTSIVQTAIEQTRRQYAPDSRTALFDLSVELSNDSSYILKG